MKRKRGAATVLALLVSFLFGYAPAAAEASFDRSARLGPTELVKRGSVVRTAIRSQNDDRDQDCALLPPPPRIVTEPLTARPVAALADFSSSDAPRHAPRAYRARAPPAA